MKKFLNLFLTFVVILTLSSCGSSDDTTYTDTDTSYTDTDNDYIDNNDDYVDDINFVYLDDLNNGYIIKGYNNYDEYVELYFNGNYYEYTRGDEFYTGTFYISYTGGTHIYFEDDANGGYNLYSNESDILEIGEDYDCQTSLGTTLTITEIIKN